MLVGELEWVFRRQPEQDVGIDAHIEIVIKKNATGRLVAAQIKGGASYLERTTADGYVFYIDREHYTYWMNFSLPVVLILVDVDGRRAWWQHVSHETVERTKTQWKIVVPFANTLDASATKAFMAIGDVSEPVKRFTELTLARPWMRALDEGKRIFVELEEWVNKSSGRGALRLVVLDDDTGKEEQALTWPVMFLASMSFEQAVRDFFPWASVDVDEELYDEAEEERWIEDNGMWDSEDGVYHYDSTHLAEHMELRREFSQYAEISPYEDNGEVAKYRLELTLNDIGRGFLAVANYLYEAEIAVRPATPDGVPQRGRRRPR